MAWSENIDLRKGNDMWLYLVLPDSAGTISSAITDAKVVAYASSCSLQIDADTLDVTSKLSCRWNATLPGNASYTVSSDALYCLKSSADNNSAYTIDHIFEAMVEGKNIGWYMGEDTADECGEVGGLDTSKPYYYGTASITSLSIEASNNEICTSSITLTGSGRPYQGGIS